MCGTRYCVFVSKEKSSWSIQTPCVVNGMGNVSWKISRDQTRLRTLIASLWRQTQVDHLPRLNVLLDDDIRCMLMFQSFWHEFKPQTQETNELQSGRSHRDWDSHNWARASVSHVQSVPNSLIVSEPRRTASSLWWVFCPVPSAQAVPAWKGLLHWLTPQGVLPPDFVFLLHKRKTVTVRTAFSSSWKPPSEWSWLINLCVFSWLLATPSQSQWKL